jgi:hypothetical protein
MDECILKTLSYFDIFDYPLTFSEIKKNLCCELTVNDEDLRDIIQNISVIQEGEGYYYFLGRHEILEKRIERGSASVQKFIKARVIAKILSFIPTIEYIGVSGSLSMSNASLSDDIDLFFITKKNTVWISRLFVHTVLFVLRQRRDRLKKNVRDKICPNMFVSADKLSFSSSRKTLYTAHELMQLKVLFDRDHFANRLLMKNKWIKEFFPNFVIPFEKRMKKSITDNLLQKLLLPVEKLLFILQKLYMRNHRTIEVITRGRAFFHPVDRQKIILEMYELRYKMYKNMYVDNIWIDKDEARFYMDEKKVRILN